MYKVPVSNLWNQTYLRRLHSGNGDKRYSIQQIIYYSSSVWANNSNKNVAKPQNVQNFAARIVTGKCKFDHITRRLICQLLVTLVICYVTKTLVVVRKYFCFPEATFVSAIKANVSRYGRHLSKH